MSWYRATNEASFLEAADAKARAYQRDFKRYEHVDIGGAFMWGGRRVDEPAVLDEAA